MGLRSGGNSGRPLMKGSLQYQIGADVKFLHIFQTQGQDEEAFLISSINTCFGIRDWGLLAECCFCDDRTTRLPWPFLVQRMSVVMLWPGGTHCICSILWNPNLKSTSRLRQTDDHGIQVNALRLNLTEADVLKYTLTDFRPVCICTPALLYFPGQSETVGFTFECESTTFSTVRCISSIISFMLWTHERKGEQPTHFLLSSNLNRKQEFLFITWQRNSYVQCTTWCEIIT